MKNRIRIGDKVMGIMGVSGGYAGTVTAIKSDGRNTVVFFVDDDGATYETLDSNITKNVPEKGKFPRKNPARRPKESPLYVKYLSLMNGEQPFMMQGTKYEYVWAEYPGGVKDIGVYSYANDLVYSYDSFRKMMNLDRMNPRSRNAMNSEGLHFIWVLEKDRSAYLHVYKSLQKATSALNTFSKIKSGTIDPSIGRIGSRGISQLGHGIGNSKMTIDDIAAEVEKKYGVQPEVIRHDLDDGDTNPLTRRKGETVRDFTSRCMSEEKASFPKTKQRIAVCLSKRRKRNPLESGASISDDEDINARASNMG
jgi:hypothetical protein